MNRAPDAPPPLRRCVCGYVLVWEVSHTDCPGPPERGRHPDPTPDHLRNRAPDAPAPARIEMPPSVGTPAWGEWYLVRMSADDQTVIRAVLADALKPFPSLHRARVKYAELVFTREWDGSMARLVWDVLQAIVGRAEMDEDIPF